MRPGPRLPAALLCALPCALLPILPPCPSPARSALFTDVTAESGIPALRYGEGANFCDLDGDGLADLFLPVVKGENRALRNLGGGRFAESGAPWGLDGHGGIGAACGDLDGDGLADLYVVRGANPYGFNLLLQQKAAGGFADVSAASGASPKRNGIAAAVADVDGDGDLDLFTANWGEDALYLNESRGGGLFFGESEEAGVGQAGRSWSGLFADFSGDGRPDLFVARGGSRDGGASRLLVNAGGGRFEDRTEAAGIGGVSWSMGAAAADFDGDGDLDLFVTSFDDRDRLFRNEGAGSFRDVTREWGVTTGRSVGAAAGDVDGDLLPDLVVAGFAGPVTFYRNEGGTSFTDATGPSGLQGHRRNEGAVMADVDGDGDLDLYVSNYDGLNRLYRNDSAGAPSLRVRGTTPAGLPPGTSAVLRWSPAEGVAGRPPARSDYLGVSGFCSQPPPELLFRLPDGGRGDLAVTLPGGGTATLEGIKEGVVEIEYDSDGKTAVRRR